jgi:cytochrome bd ubiquinol oxidase subunit I
MTALAVTTLDLARAQFATTSIFHFLFVPLTLGLAPIVAVMQTIWHRGGDEKWLRLTRFFGAVLLINFAVGVATGLVQEFQFGMNWSVYSRFVGNVFGAPLALEGLGAFFLESVFLGLWIFGWERLPARLHLASIWLATLGTYLSAYFILVANSWMQHPAGYELSGGEARLTDVWALLGSKFALMAFVHTALVGLTTGAMVVLGIACWHLARRRNVQVFRSAALLAIVVAVPVTSLNMVVGSRFGIVTTELQPMKISGAEALWKTEQPASFPLFQIGGFTSEDPDPSFSIAVPDLLSLLSTGSLDGEVTGLDELNAQYQRQYGPGNYVPPVEALYWSMRGMAYLGALMCLVALLGAWLYWRGALAQTHWFLRTAMVATCFPFLAAMFGWVLTEVGRQPWIVQGLLKTSDANSPSVSATTIAVSLAVFAVLYTALAITDFVLIRRFARLDPAPVPVGAAPTEPTAVAAG